MPYLKDKSGRKFLCCDALNDRGDFEHVEGTAVEPQAPRNTRRTRTAAPAAKPKATTTKPKATTDSALEAWED